jgi:glyoxylase-like metal-dependent hydrolase (beta-lactamase superfamily II)
MKSHIFALALVAGVATAFTASAQPSSVVPKVYPVIQGKTYKFERIADGVYYATGGFGSNNVVIINDADVMLVDTGTTPANARRFVADVRLITTKPIRYVVNTHWHYDHTDGNQIFGPGVQIIAAEYLRNAIVNFDVLNREPFKTAQANAALQAENLRKQADAEADPAKKADINKQLSDARRIVRDLAQIKPTPPNVTYSQKMVINSGGREIDLLFLGRGHTGGDTVVFLPKEKIVCTGDLMESRLAYMGDAFFDEWITTLEALKKLDWDVDLPGHGVPFGDKGLVTAYQSYLTDLMKQVADLRAQGVSPEDAARRVDLTSHAKDFPQITGPGAEVRGVRRVYAWMDETGKR